MVRTRSRDLAHLSQKTKDRADRLRTMLDEKKPPEEKVIIKVKKVPVTVPAPKSRTMDVLIQTTNFADQEMENIRDSVERFVGCRGQLMI